jgi:5-methylcytosine-specific restriction endonuclease McrA
MKRAFEVIDLTGDSDDEKCIAIVKKPRQRKASIPKVLKQQVWDRYIGRTIGEKECCCCNKNKITQMSYHCGHVISEANGGTLDIYNLRPICSSCNLSMGKKDMRAFMKKCHFGELADYVYDMETD